MSKPDTSTRAASGATARQPPAPTTTHHDCEPATATPAESPGSRVRQVEDPDVDAILDALVDTAPPLPYEVRARIAFLLGGDRRTRAQPSQAA